MSVLVDVLLALGVAIELLCAVTLLRARNALDRAHLIGPATMLAPLFLGLAIIVHQPLTTSTLKVLLVLVAMLAAGPIMTHATGHAVWRRSGADLGLESRFIEPEEKGS
jgi:multisubunit Na+/H+ antiporter MnhG subunit